MYNKLRLRDFEEMFSGSLSNWQILEPAESFNSKSAAQVPGPLKTEDGTFEFPQMHIFTLAIPKHLVITFSVKLSRLKVCLEHFNRGFNFYR